MARPARRGDGDGTFSWSVEYPAAGDGCSYTPEMKLVADRRLTEVLLVADIRSASEVSNAAAECELGVRLAETGRWKEGGLSSRQAVEPRDEYAVKPGPGDACGTESEDERYFSETVLCV